MPIIARMRNRYCGGSAAGAAIAATITAQPIARDSGSDDRQPPFRAIALRTALAQDALRLQGKDADQHKEGDDIAVAYAKAIGCREGEDGDAKRLDDAQQ